MKRFCRDPEVELKHQTGDGSVVMALNKGSVRNMLRILHAVNCRQWELVAKWIWR